MRYLKSLITVSLVIVIGLNSSLPGATKSASIKSTGSPYTRFVILSMLAGKLLSMDKVFAKGKAAKVTVSEGDAVTWTVDSKKFKLKVSNFKKKRIKLKFNDRSLTLKVGDSKEIDVNGDKNADVMANLKYIEDGKAVITFTRVTGKSVTKTRSTATQVPLLISQTGKELLSGFDTGTASMEQIRHTLSEAEEKELLIMIFRLLGYEFDNGEIKKTGLGKKTTTKKRATGKDVIKLTGTGYNNRHYKPSERLLLKRILATLGYEADVETPDWTARTDSVVRKFQDDNKLITDGKIGPLTLATMSESLGVYRDYFGIPGSGDEKKSMVANVPDKSQDIRKFKNQRNEKFIVGDIIKYFNFELDKFRYARISKINGNIATIHDWVREETYSVDIDKIQ